ncbi:MAG: cytochrome c [Chloroflexi bacterium]|nr:cytochrome c [Chloroflexota bacterium]
MQQQSFDSSLLIVLMLLIASFVLTGCDSELSGADLYTLNCAGCHGAAGKGGSTIALSDAAYLATHDDKTMTQLTSEGVPNTVMRAFGKTKGGTLTDEQITAIVKYLCSARTTN